MFFELIFFLKQEFIQNQPTIKADKPPEAEDLHFQLIFVVFFSFHPIYPQQCCKRTATPAKNNSQQQHCI
jgi:hypothetical protein